MAALENLRIRHFAPDDYRAFARLWNYAYPENKQTSISLQLLDQARDQPAPGQRWIAEVAGSVVGVGGFEPWMESAQPGHWLLHVVVDEEHQRRGIGRALYEKLIHEWEKHLPLTARAWVREDRAPSVRFLTSRGFAREKLRWNVWLDIRACDLSPFAGDQQGLPARGIRIKTFTELKSDPQRNHKLHQLYCEAVRVIGTFDDSGPLSLDDYIHLIDGHETLSEASVVALEGDAYVGLWRLCPGPLATIWSDIMYVKREQRRHGVAVGLLMEGLSYAQQTGYSILKAHTDEHNVATLALTEKFGFERWPAQLLLGKYFAVSA